MSTGVRITHIGGPTTLIEVGGWRLLAASRVLTAAPAPVRDRVRWPTPGVPIDLP